MYYIVFFKDLNKSLIVPKLWLKDIKIHKEKFYNNSLNRAQTFVCFYTTNPMAFDDIGLPKGDFPPNFQERFRGDLNGDGLYLVKLKAYKGNKSLFKLQIMKLCVSYY